MQILKGDLSNIKGISPSGLCVGVHRAGAVHHKMVAAGTTLLVSAIQNGLQLRYDCTEAVCGTDRVKILSGEEHLSEKTDNEELTLEMMQAGPNERLGCVARVLGDVTVELPD